MSESKKKSDKEMDVGDVTAFIGPFSARMTEEKVKLGDTVFTLKALSSTQIIEIYNLATDSKGVINPLKRSEGYLRFGIVAIDGAYDMDGNAVKDLMESVKLNGKEYPAMRSEGIAMLHPDVFNHLYSKIDAISHLTEGERKKLDFIIPSPN